MCQWHVPSGVSSPCVNAPTPPPPPGLGWGLLWDLGPSSSLLDIGSGYGKVVFHLRLMARMRSTVGVECVQSRHQIALKSKALLEMEEEEMLAGGTASGRTSPESILVDTLAPKEEAPKAAARLASASTHAAAHAPRSESAPSSAAPEQVAAAGEEAAEPPAAVTTLSAGAFYGVDFRHMDATAEAKLVYTHIYIFDWVFSKGTLKKLAGVLQASPFYVLLSFRHPAEWWSNGLTKVQSQPHPKTPP